MEPVVGGVSETNATTPVSPAAVEPDPRRWSILAVVVIAQLMVVLDGSIVTIALPSIQRALHISVANRQWAITAYTLAFGGLLLLGGRMADFGGRRRMLIVGLVGFVAASALCAARLSTRPCSWGPGRCRAHLPPSWPLRPSMTITFHRRRGTSQSLRRLRGCLRCVGRHWRAGGRVFTAYASWRWCLLVNFPDRLVGHGRGISAYAGEAGPAGKLVTTSRGRPRGLALVSVAGRAQLAGFNWHYDSSDAPHRHVECKLPAMPVPSRCSRSSWLHGPPCISWPGNWH